MDPLSIASGVAGLITLADVVISRTYNTIIKCKNASEDACRLLREVQSLLGILHSVSTLERKLGASSIRSQIPGREVADCQKTLQTIRENLEKSDPREDGVTILQRAKRTLKWPISSSKMEKILADMERHKSTFNLAMTVDTLDRLLTASETQTTTSNKIGQLEQSLQHLVQTEMTKETRRMLQVLGADSADGPYCSNLRLHHPGTCLWFLDCSAFRNWCTTSNSKLWVYGIPGAGKTLARHNEECLAIVQAKFERSGHVDTPAWVNDGSDLTTLLESMFACFEEVSILIDGVDECHDASTISETLARLCESPNVRMLISSRQEHDMKWSLANFQQISIAAESQDLRLYVPAEIELRQRRQKLRIRNPDLKDEMIDKLVNGAQGMFRWVACQLDHLCNLTTDRERLLALESLPPTLYSTYDRTLERLNAKGESACRLVERVLKWLVSPIRGPQRLPGGIVLPQMSASELCVAISIDFDDNRTSLDSIPSVDEIMIHSSSFLRCDNNYVEFAHFTVEEYLRSIDTQGKPRLARYRCDEHSANAYAVETCLTFLNLDDFRPNLCANLGTLQQLLETHPFYIRASLAWNICSASSRSSERALRSVDKLFSSPNVSNYDNWLQVRLLASRFEIGNDVVGMEPHSSGHSLRCTGIDSSFLTRSIAVASSTSKIHVAAMFHLVDQIPRLFKTETQLNALSPLGTTLHCALYGEWAMSFRMQVDDMTRTRPGAHAETLFPTISLLVKLGADARIPFSTRGKIVTTLYLATWVSATQRILDAGAIPDESTARAIIHDLGGGFIDLDTEPLAKFPLESVNVRDRHYVGQLMMKLDWDSAVVTSNTTLLKQVTIFDLEETLRDSCEYNELSIFRQIFEVRNLDVNHRFRRDGASFLHVACGGSAADVVAYLIEQCADVNSRGPDGSSPLKYYFASDFWWNTHMHLNGHFPKQDCLATFHSMVANKANLHRLTDNCESALMMWAQCDMLQLDVLEELLRVLLKQDIDIKSRNASGQNVWHHLAYRNSLKLSQMLKSAMDPVSLRSVLDVADESGITPLLAAITAGQLGMFEFLVEHGCDVTSKTAKGESILHLAASGIWSDGDTFQMLLTKYLHSGVATSTFNGATIAHYCVISIAKGVHVGASTEMPRRFRESMAALKASSISITDTNCDGETPLDVMCQWVAEEGHHSGPICSDCNAFLVCFELLVTHNHAKDEQMQAAVTWAILIRALKAAAYSLDSTDYNYPVDTVCSRAICIAIDRGLRLDYLDGAELDLDSIFDIAARLRQESLLLKLLDTASIDFERPSRYKPHHTPLQSLCAHCCPVSTIRAATSRTKNIRAGDSQGLGPLHLLFSNDEAQHSNMAPVIHALLDAGVDPNEQTSRTGRTALMMAAGLDNISIDAFGTLVRSGAKVDVVDVRGCNALFYACNSGTEYAINALIAAGSASLHAEAEFFDFPKREILLCSPVHLAARRGMPGIVQTLLELERSVEGSDADDRSPSPLLMVENKETVRLLLDHGYDPNLLDASLGMTPLHVASWAGNVQIVHALLQAGCDKEALSHNGLSAWMFAIMKGHTRIAETLESFNNNSSGQTVATIPLLPPAENRKPKSAATDDSKDPSSRSVTSYAILRPPLGRVIVRRNLQDGIWQHLVKSPLQVIEKLVMGGLDMGLRFNSCTCTPMLVAVAYDRVNVVTYLVSIGVPLLTEDKCPLHLQREDTVAGLLAAAPIWTRLVEQWLHRPEWRTQMRQKLLVCMIASAIEYGNPDTLDILLSKIPGPFFSRDLIDCVGWVPFISPSEFLHQAAASSKASAISCATMLLSHGVDVDSLDRFGRTPLHLAALCGHLDMAILLVAHNAEVNYTYPSGGTALSIAAEAGHLSMVKYLLASSAHQNLCSSPILAPLASAATQGHYPIFRALLEAGATANTWDYYVLCHAGYRSALMLDERYFCATQGPDPFHYDFLPQKTALPILRSIPSARRALFLATLDIRYDTTALYSVALDGIGRWVEFAIRYGAAINMEGGLQGTPLMAACHAGHLPIVKQLVRSGALLAYWNGSSYVSSLVGAQSHPKIIRWLLVGRFTETLRLTGTSTGGDLGLVDVAEDLYCGDANAPNVELILKHEIKGYLEDNFWFVPPRRFVDNGGGCFDAVAILPSEFAKYKPTYI